MSFLGAAMSDYLEKKNPSRKDCESAIRRILMAEVLEQGQNKHFKNAMDFMNYFESLYPASPSLIKQVQRAIKSMNIPKDENGFFVIDKTPEQLAQDKEISALLKKTSAQVHPLYELEQVFLKADEKYKDYLYLLIKESDTLKDKYVTILDSSNGLIFYTKDRRALERILQSLIEKGMK